MSVSSVNVDCLVFDYAYNTNELLFADFLEAGIQKVDEARLTMSDFWRQYFRLLPLATSDTFTSLLLSYYLNTNTLNDLGRFVLGDQVDEHIAKYRTYLAQGMQVILIPHSQGGLYVNEEWAKLTEAEKAVTDVVAVATPAGFVAKNGPYTTLEEDEVAKFLFPLALPANAANEEPCEDAWLCHGFKESYLHGVHSKTRIVDEIVALLPAIQEHCRIEGVFRDWDNEIISGGKVTLWKNVSPYDVAMEITSDSEGHYCIADVPDGFYFIEASQGDQLFGGRNVLLQPGIIEPVFLDFPIAFQQ